ncbi:Matrix metallopeptidase 21 [Mactra antiquata]
MASVWEHIHTYMFIFVYILTIVGTVFGERFFQYRDHRDQRMYERDSNTLQVHNKLEAEQLLEKYGYLHCQIRDRHKRSFFPDFFSEGGSKTRHDFQNGNLQPCTRRAVRKAIRDYQKKYNLPETGVLDRQTKKLMSTSRCGNSDEEEKTVNKVTDRTSTTNDILSDKFSIKNSDITSFSKTDIDQFKSRPWKRSVSNSNIMNVISGAQTRASSSLSNRRKYIEDTIERIKREDTNTKLNKVLHIKKRSVKTVFENIVNDTMVNKASPLEGQKFEKQVINWRLLSGGYSSRIPVEDQRATLDLAFRMWSEVIPLEFVEETSGDISNVDIEVAFGTGAHQNCKRDFDGNGGEVAHSFSTGNMHFDDDEYFKTMRSFTPDGIYLLRVAVHEIGHVLGLLHTNKKYSIMYAIYEKENSGPDFELGWEDRKAVQQVYGVCKGRFTTVFDWVRKNEKGSFIFNTYFFRGNHYWMYENHSNRTRYGDPLYVTSEWRGVPDEPDGYAQVFYITDNIVVDDAYFFKGENVYKYDSENDNVYEGWPKKIADVFTGKDGQAAIPNDLDTVFFDMRDKNIYFFKNDMVYVYDPKVPKESQGCCVRTNKIVDEFPSVEDSTEPLPTNFDAVYYSYVDESMYFIKDEDVWKNVAFHPRQKHIKNGVKYIGKWFDIWFDICDVTTHSTHLFDFQKHT